MINGINAYKNVANMAPSTTDNVQDFFQSSVQFSNSLAEANAAYNGQMLDTEVRKTSKSNFVTNKVANMYDVLKEAESVTNRGINKQADANEVVTSLVNAEITLKEIQTYLQTFLNAWNELQKTQV